VPEFSAEKSKILQSIILTLSADLTWLYCLYILALLGAFILILTLARYYCLFSTPANDFPTRNLPLELEFVNLKQEEAEPEETDDTEATTSEEETATPYPPPKKRYTVVLTPRKVHFAKNTRH
jgi:hypothetical protein